MRRLPAAIGLLLLGTLFSGGSVAAENYRVYERLKETMESTSPTGKADAALRAYLVGVAKSQHITITPEDADAIASGRLDLFCQSGTRSLANCPTIFQALSDVAAETRRFQSLGRSLLLTAESHELGIDGFPGEPLPFALRLPGIVRLWQAGTDTLSAPLRSQGIRFEPRPQKVTETMLKAVGPALLGETKTVDHRAVWRYRYGIAHIVDGAAECADQVGNDELQALTIRRWCALERALTPIRYALSSSALRFDPPLHSGESILFPPFALADATHVIVWMQVQNIDGRIVPDAGLSWDIPLEPVSPALVPEPQAPDCMTEMQSTPFCAVVKDLGIVPGGLYPDPPDTPTADEGLCHLPIGAEGYLCRPQERESCATVAEEDTANPGAITLTSCIPSSFKGPTTITASGPDVCRIGWWKTPVQETDPTVADTAGSDQGRLPGTCSRCAVDITCGSCQNHAETKDANGVIHICLPSTTPDPGKRYELLHALAHAQQFCSLPAERTMRQLFPDAKSCCAMEREANMVACTAMGEDGHLARSGITVDTCASALANLQCTDFGAQACSPLSATTVNAALSAEWNRLQREGVPGPSCQDLVTQMSSLEPRAASMEEGLKNPCSPGCRSRYPNTIGNNLCMLGQCIEQTTEESRLVPGRTGFDSADASFPWDACVPTATSTASLSLVPSLSAPILPPYNPRALVESLDRALCQVSGLPTMFPPALCAYTTERLLASPPPTYAALGIALGDQMVEQQNPMDALRLMMPSVAVRMGVERSEQYLRWAGQSLSDLLSEANRLLASFAETSLPLSACPREAGDTENLCSVLRSPSP